MHEAGSRTVVYGGPDPDMQPSIPIDQARFRVAVLPARAAYLIQAGSRPGLRRAVQSASARWAGVTEPIIPVRKSGQVDDWWLQVVAIAGVDGLVNVDAGQEAAQLVSEKLSLPLVQLVDIDRAGITRFTVHPSYLLSHLPGRAGTLTISRSDGDLWECVAAGDLDALHEHNMGRRRLVVRRPTAADEIGRSEVFRSTLLDATAAQFGELTATDAPSATPTVLWITTPNSYRDCLEFWNVRAIRPLQVADMPMILLPHRDIDDWVDYGEQFTEALARHEDIEPDVVVHSISVSGDRLDQIASSLGLERSEEQDRFAGPTSEPPLRSSAYRYRRDIDPRQFVGFGRTYGSVAHSVVPLDRERIVIRVSSPVDFTGPGLVLASMSSPAFDGLPRRSATATLVEQSAIWSRGDLQIGTRTARAFDFNLSIPSLREATWSLLRDATVAAELSDKGRLAARLEELVLDATLLQDGVVEVIRQLTTPRPEDLVIELQPAEGNSDRVRVQRAAGDRVARRFLSMGELEGIDEPTATSAVERLVEHSWAERGLRAECDRCGLSDFVPLQERQFLPHCPACGAARHYQSSTSSTLHTLHYRLDTHLDRASGEGIVSHLVALAVLRVGHEDSTFVLPGLNITLPDDQDMEIGLYGIRAGRVISGAVKPFSELGMTHLERNLTVSARLHADQHVIASGRPISDEALARAEAAAKEIGLEILAIEGTSLKRSSAAGTSNLR